MRTEPPSGVAGFPLRPIRFSRRDEPLRVLHRVVGTSRSRRAAPSRPPDSPRAPRRSGGAPGSAAPPPAGSARWRSPPAAEGSTRPRSWPAAAGPPPSPAASRFGPHPGRPRLPASQPGRGVPPGRPSARLGPAAGCAARCAAQSPGPSGRTDPAPVAPACRTPRSARPRGCQARSRTARPSTAPPVARSGSGSRSSAQATARCSRRSSC